MHLIDNLKNNLNRCILMNEDNVTLSKIRSDEFGFCLIKDVGGNIMDKDFLTDVEMKDYIDRVEPYMYCLTDSFIWNVGNCYDIGNNEFDSKSFELKELNGYYNLIDINNNSIYDKDFENIKDLVLNTVNDYNYIKNITCN